MLQSTHTDTNTSTPGGVGYRNSCSQHMGALKPQGADDDDDDYYCCFVVVV